MQLGSAYVEISSNMAQFSRNVDQARNKVERSTQQMRKNFDRVKRSISQLSSAARWGFLAYSAALGGATYAAQKQEKAMAKLSQQLKNHNELTRENMKVLTDQASALQRVTQFGDEQIIAGQAMLASFNLTTKQIKELTPRMLNLAIMSEKTSGQQADLAAVAKMVGVALGGQAGRLVQMGIRISDTKREMLKMADAEEKINILMEIFDENARGLAEATGKTLAGSLSKAKNAMSDLAEEIGFLLKPVIVKATERIVDKVNDWIDALRVLTPAQKKAIVQMTLMGGAALALVGSLSLIGKAAGLVVAAGTLIAGVMGLIMAPIGLLTVGVAALALAWTNNWGDIQEKTEAVYKAIAETLDWEGFKKKVAAVWEKTKQLVDVVGKVAITGYEWAKDKIADLGAWLDEHIWDIFNKTLYLAGFIGGIFISTYKWIKDKMLNVWEWIPKNLPDFMGKVGEIGNIIGGVFVSTYEWLKDKMASILEWLPKNLPDFVNKTLELGSIIGGIFISGYKWLKEKFLSFVSWLSTNIPASIGEVYELGGIIGGVFVDTWKWLSDKMASLWESLKNWFETDPKGKKSLLDKALAQKMETSIDEVLLKVSDAIYQLPDWAKWSLKVGPQAVTAAFLGKVAASKLLGMIKPGLTPLKLALDVILIFGAFQLGFTIGTWIRKHFKPLSDFINYRVNLFAERHPLLYEAVVELQKGNITVKGIQGIATYIGELLLDGLKTGFAPSIDFYSWLWGAYQKQINDIYGIGWDMAKQIGEGIIDFFAELPKKIPDFLGALWEGIITGKGFDKLREKLGKITFKPPKIDTFFERAAQAKNIDVLYLAAIRMAERGREGLDMGIKSYSDEFKKKMKQMYPGLAEDTRGWQIAAAALSTSIYWENFKKKFNLQADLTMKEASKETKDKFIEYMGAGYAPLEAGDDPMDLIKIGFPM